MKQETRSPVDIDELEASLVRLGVQELEERMEVSPLLAGQGVHSMDRCHCEFDCSYGPEVHEEVVPDADGFLPWGFGPFSG